MMNPVPVTAKLLRALSFPHVHSETALSFEHISLVYREEGGLNWVFLKATSLSHVGGSEIYLSMLRLVTKTVLGDSFDVGGMYSRVVAGIRTAGFFLEQHGDIKVQAIISDTGLLISFERPSPAEGPATSAL